MRGRGSLPRLSRPAYIADPGSPASSLLGQLLAVGVEGRRMAALVTTEERRLALLRTSQLAENAGELAGQAQLGYGLQIRVAGCPPDEGPGELGFRP